MSVRIFISAVSDEFRDYRDQLRTDLTRHNVEVKVQEDFKDSGGVTLDKLDLYITNCDAVIHLVGDMTGSDAKPASTAAILAKYPDLAEKIPPLKEPLTKGEGISYTQWEAWLAIYHGKALLIAQADAAAPRGPKYEPTDASRAAQRMHLQRLSDVERYPGVIFTSPDHLAKYIAFTTILDLMAMERRVVPRARSDDESPRRPHELRRLFTPSIFLAYRREDTRWITGRIFDRLQVHFGKSSIFIDVETILPGMDFRKYIEGILERCDVLIAVIGPHWVGADEPNKSRIFNPDDWVRIEIEIALNKKIPIISVLVDRTPMPGVHDLPESLRSIAYLQEARIDPGRDFNVHMQRLIRAVAQFLGWKVLVVRYGRLIAFVAIVLFVGFYMSQGYLFERRNSEFSGAQAAIQSCNAEFTLRCAQEGGAAGSSETLAHLKSCKNTELFLSDDSPLRWKDIWTTSVYSFGPGGGGPGGGLDDDVLKVGGWGDWYFSLIQFNLPQLRARPKFAIIALYSKASEGASVSLALDQIIHRWDFPKGGTLWWKDRPGHREITTASLPAPRKEQWYIIDLTTIVQEWTDGKSENYGIQIRPVTNFGSFVFFVSSDAVDKSKIPRLIFCELRPFHLLTCRRPPRWRGPCYAYQLTFCPRIARPGAGAARGRPHPLCHAVARPRPARPRARCRRVQSAGAGGASLRGHAVTAPRTEPQFSASRANALLGYEQGAIAARDDPVRTMFGAEERPFYEERPTRAFST
jgi:hypothetical protein